MTDIVFLYCTAPDAESAGVIAEALIEEKLAACVNIHAPVRSIYRWEDAVEDAAETPFIVKTSQDAAPAAAERIISLHPYDTPCVAALPIERAGSSPAFLDWIRASTKM